VRRLLAALALVLCLAPAAAQAATSPEEVLADPALEQRARALGKELRCLVCQNQSIDDSDADLARDLRRIVRERIAAGESDQAILSYLVDRYGQFVLLRPPLEPATWLLWLGPAAVLLLGAGLLVAFYRSRGREPPAPAELSAEEQRRLDRLLAEPESGPG
jgi:cytochrome c-type biogenesis protein CcmH